MTLDVSSEFIDVLRDGGSVSNRLFIGSSDYSNRVQSWPKIKRKSDLKSQSMTIKLANHDGGLNSFYEDTYNSAVEVSIELGVETGSEGFTIVDSDDNGGTYLNFWANSGHLFCATGNNGVHSYLYDSSGTLEFANKINDTGICGGVWANDTHLFAANGQSGLSSYAFTSSGNLTSTDSNDPGGIPSDIWGNTDFVFAANTSGGIDVFSYDSSGSLTYIKSNDVGSGCVDVFGNGDDRNILVMGASAMGLYTGVYSSDGTITTIDQSCFGGEAWGVWCDESSIIVGEYQGSACMRSYTYNDSAELTFIDAGSNSSSGKGVFSIRDQVYVADEVSGLQIYSKDSNGKLTFLSKKSLSDNTVGVVAVDYSSPNPINVFATNNLDGLISGWHKYSPEYANIYTGDLTNIKYRDRLATVTTKDKLWRLTDSIIGTNETPVSFTNIIPTDIAWDIMTCYGGMDTVQSDSNVDIDYDSFLAWSSIFSSDNIDMSAYYDGDKILTALSDLAEATRSTIWINEDGKFEFDRFGGITVASETFTILEREQLDFEVDVTAKDAVNNYGVNYNWDVESSYFVNIDYSVNSDSVSNIGELSENLEIESIWYTNQTNASLIGQREVFLYGKPPKVWQAATGLVGADKTLSQLSRLVNSFYGVTSADVWRVTEQQIDLGSGRVDLTFDSAVSLYGFYLDIDSLDQTSRFLL